MQTVTLVDLTVLWAITGSIIAALFLTVGIDRIDEDARDSYFFRPLIAPGVILLWPLVLWRWRVLETGRDDWKKRHGPPRRAHSGAALLLAVLVPLIFVSALLARQHWPVDVMPVRVAPPAGGQVQ
ncbi:MAG: hypothetical protein RIC36_11570 [Rhodospirillales bacterium]